MTIDVLVCRADGTQEIVQREVADDYLDSGEPDESGEG